jgi:hypothetical protein
MKKPKKGGLGSHGLYYFADEIEPYIADLERKLEVAVRHFNYILNPIDCPYCSMDEPCDGVPCYCGDDLNNPREIAKDALAEIEGG